MPIAIRKMTRDDLPHVRRMCGELVAHVAEGGGDPEFVWNQANIQEHMFGASPCLHGFVAVSGGRPVGYTVATPSYEVDTWTRQLEVLDFYVDASHRGMGIGKRLLAANAELAAEMGFERINGLVHKGNASMIAIYGRMGAPLDPEYLVVKIPLGLFQAATPAAA